MKRVLTPRFCWLLLLALVLEFALPTRVLAHAEVIRSEPAANAELASAPQQVRLWFNEPIAPLFTFVQIFNAQGEPVKPLTLYTDPAQPTLVTVDLPVLPAGAYNLVWKTLSDADGHFVEGRVAFAVGANANLPALAAGSTATIPWVEMLLRWLGYGTILALIGAVALIFQIFEPALQTTPAADGRFTIIAAAYTRIWVWAVALALTALCIGVALLGWQAAASPLATAVSDAAPDSVVLQTVGQLVAQTQWGRWWLARQLILLLLLIITYGMASAALLPEAAAALALGKEPAVKAARDKSAQRSSAQQLPTVAAAGPVRQLSAPSQRLLILGLVLALAVSMAAAGHAATLTTDRAIAVGAIALHLLAVGVWIGGLFILSLAFLPLLRRDQTIAASLISLGWRPFGRLALFSGAVVAATGLYSVGREVASLDAAWATLYGRALLGKIALVLGLALVGLLNATLVHPRLSAPLARWLGHPSGWTPLALTRLPGLVLAETLLGLGVLLATALIASSAPARAMPAVVVWQSVGISADALEPILTPIAFLLLLFSCGVGAGLVVSRLGERSSTRSYTPQQPTTEHAE